MVEILTVAVFIVVNVLL